MKAWLLRFRGLNPLLLASMVGLTVIGVLYVYSACSVRATMAQYAGFTRRTTPSLSVSRIPSRDADQMAAIRRFAKAAFSMMENTIAVAIAKTRIDPVMDAGLAGTVG